MIRTALTASAILLALAGCGEAGKPTAATAPPPAAITTAPAALVEHGAVERLPGTVRPARSATLQARVPGVVGSIAAMPGSTVAAGAVLVEIDAQEIAAKRDQAAATAAQAAADFERINQLFEKQSVTKSEFDAAKARAAGTAAAAAEATIMVGYTRMTAPFAGVVVRKHVEIGDLISPGRPVLDLEDPTSLRLEIEVPESLAGTIAMGARLPVEVAAAGLVATGQVAEITPASDPVSRSVLVKLALPAGTGGLRSGQFGRADVAVAGGRMLAVPAAAVVRRGQLDAVFVVADGVARLRLVRLGAADGERLGVRAGLAEGEVVAVEGAAALRDGQPVTVR